MKVSLALIMLLALTNAKAADEWEAVVWVYQYSFTQTGDWNDLEKVDETEHATEEMCLSHLNMVTKLKLRNGFEVQSELTRFGPEISGEPLWRLQLNNSNRPKYVENHKCERKVLFTLVRKEN